MPSAPERAQERVIRSIYQYKTILVNTFHKTNSGYLNLTITFVMVIESSKERAHREDTESTWESTKESIRGYSFWSRVLKGVVYSLILYYIFHFPGLVTTPSSSPWPGSRGQISPLASLLRAMRAPDWSSSSIGPR